MGLKSSTDPFYRNGKARPLTAQDYANITGITIKAATMKLSQLVKGGKVVSERSSGSLPAIYEVAK